MTKEQIVQGYLMNSPKVVAEMLYETIERYEGRSCATCRYWNDTCFNVSVNTTGFCMYYGISNGDFEEDMKRNFSCNKWKSK